MRHDTNTVSGHLNSRATTSSVHVESAFLFRDPEPSASSESPTGKALSLIYTPNNPRDLEESGLGSVATVRNGISHGAESGITMAVVRQYFEQTTVVLDDLCDLLDPP